MSAGRAAALRAAVLGCLLLLGAAWVLAATSAPTVDWWVFGSAGAPSSAGSVSINDTLGQPVIGPSAGKGVSLGAGYWYGGAPPDLDIHKSVMPPIVLPGQDITYTVSFSNIGPSIACGVLITDIVPLTVTNVTFVFSGATVTRTAGVTYAWQVQNLAPAEGGIITITGQVQRFCNPSSTPLTNTATIIATTADANPGDNAASATVMVRTTQAPTATFDASPQSCCAPLTVWFTDTSTAGNAVLTGWWWAFGDGGTDTISRTQHTYDTPGVYEVTLTVSDANGCSDTITRTDYITASGVLASFDISPVSGCPPLTVYFTDTSSAIPGSVSLWHWDFGDGAGTSTAQNPSYTYNCPGAYTVTLTVTDTHGCVATHQGVVTATVCLEVSKSDLQDPIPATWRVRYAIEVRNTSQATAGTVWVTDTLPTGAYFLPIPENDGWAHSDSIATRPIHSLLGGERVALELTLATHSLASGLLTNTVAAQWDCTVVTATENTWVEPKPLPTSLPTPTPTLGPGTVVVIQKGGPGDSEDTYIYRYTPRVNYHLDPLLRVGYKQLFAALLRFDLSPIPSGVVIEQATLEVYAFGWGGADITIAAHAISSTVTISETTWNQAQSGNPWTAPGCSDTEFDRREAPEYMLTTAGPARWYGFDLTALVRQWLNGALPNNGILLRQDAYALFAFFFASSEHNDVALRPKLVVRYH